MSNCETSGSAFRRCLCVVLALVLVLGMTACGSQKQEPLRAPTMDSIKTDPVETVYGDLAFPEDLYEHLRHMEVTEGDIVMEIFYMVTEAGEKELFRIYYADPQVGTHLGYLTTETGEIPVSYSLCEYADEDFADEEERKLFHSMMDAFSVVVNSIYADERFSETRAMETVGEQEAKLRYWDVTLPDNVSFTETEEGGNYRADFYGEVSGERIDLYAIILGNVESESILGFYTVNGEQKPVVVETYDMGEYDVWPAEERTAIYQMMESLNTVIQAIMADKNFTEFVPGA